MCYHACMGKQAEFEGLKRWYVVTDVTPARKTLWAATAEDARQRAESRGFRVIVVRPAPSAIGQVEGT